ncbi:cilia- and flagella-associated protein 77 isoform X2 [Rhincodon typus]|uniref:cilia- and flagella-associated protein 77 isoform X2 n=1 Tax=Rhincodon typus TaxID=259920 RepID=UPI00202ECF28|nr:cilia- and flagella-associated protein 77 isoform X2 [Rhincodon typus]
MLAPQWSENDRVGKIRDSMLANPLIIKSELGKGKRSGNPLPGPTHVYGTIERVYDGGVPAAIGHWHTIKPRKQETLHKLRRDFAALNKAAIKAGLVTPREIYQFRATHNVGILGKEVEKKEGMLPEITFGMPVRPSTPMFDLLENKFQKEWLDEQKGRDQIKQKKKTHQVTLVKNYQTRAAVLSKAVPKVDPAPIVHPKRYQKIGPHLDTFRSMEARRAAFDANWLDSAARSGPHGHGVYAFE